MLSIGLGLLTGSLLPRVEDPWPDQINLELPFVMAGAFAVLASVVKAGAPEARRDKAISQWGIAGFLVGTTFYLISLAVQIGSGL